MKPQIQWVGPYQDSSGYADATRNYIYAILKADKVDVSVSGVSFEQEKTAHKLDEIIAPYVKKNHGAPINIVHLTPENYIRFRDPKKYNIAYTVWETDKLPDSWICEINKMQEVWVPSQWNIKVFKRSGITIPIFCIPHAIPLPDASIPMPQYEGDDPNLFWFYSIFQWTERKNWRDLLTAYYTEFSGVQNVVLAVKAYRRNTGPQEVNIIKGDVGNLKRDLRLPSYPKILLFQRLLPASEITQLHMRGDCFVLPSRAEGFGITFADAMAMGNPTIGCEYGGALEFMNSENSLLTKCSKRPVQGMDFMTIYNGTMNWGAPDIMDLRKKMRWVYENRDKAKAIGKKAQEDIKNNYSYTAIGNLISDRIEAICKERGF